MNTTNTTTLHIRIKGCPESECDAVAFRKVHGLLPSGSNYVKVTLTLDPELAKAAMLSSDKHLYLSVNQVKALLRLKAQQMGHVDWEIENALGAVKGAAGGY
jgi:hypothetical protein